jgi:hypothetical protein
MTGSQTNGPDAERSGGNRADRLLGYGDRLVYILVAALFLLAATAMALFSAANLVLHAEEERGLSRAQLRLLLVLRQAQNERLQTPLIVSLSNHDAAPAKRQTALLSGSRAPLPAR